MYESASLDTKKIEMSHGQYLTGRNISNQLKSLSKVHIKDGCQLTICFSRRSQCNQYKGDYVFANVFKINNRPLIAKCRCLHAVSYSTKKNSLQASKPTKVNPVQVPEPDKTKDRPPSNGENKKRNMICSTRTDGCSCEYVDD